MRTYINKKQVIFIEIEKPKEEQLWKRGDKVILRKPAHGWMVKIHLNGGFTEYVNFSDAIGCYDFVEENFAHFLDTDCRIKRPY